MMPKYSFSEEGTILTIYDSYSVPKAKFHGILNSIKALHASKPIFQRSDKSLRREWACHNFLYRIGYKRSHTKDVDLDYPQPFYIRAFYAVTGCAVWIFIK